MKFGALFVFTVGFLDITLCKKNMSFSWYSTIGEMSRLSELESLVIAELESKIVDANEKLEKLQKSIKKARDIGKQLLDLNDKTQGELKVFQMKERYETEWLDLREYFEYFFSEKFHQNFSHTVERFPGDSDMDSVLMALLHLQKAYNLEASDLSEGYILGKNNGKRLSVSECVYLTSKSCGKYWKLLCEDWANVTLARLAAGEEAEEVTKENVMGFVETVHDGEKFQTICSASVSSELKQIPSQHLYCQMWDNHKHPWLILQPVKMEIHSVSPDVVQFYDVISDKDIEYLKNLAKSKLASAQTFALESVIEVDSYRVAHNCWLSKRNNKCIQRLDVLVSALTGLEVSRNSEQLQIANYGIGGHYFPHEDFMDYSAEKEIKSPNRKATFMFYLSDVEIGGVTVFIQPRIFVNPVKGSAVFWHNLLYSGEQDKRTMHGSCPVLLGDKWVANKWIWETKKEVCKPKEYIGRLH